MRGTLLFPSRVYQDWCARRLNQKGWVNIVGLDIRLTDITVALAELGAHVDIWSGITGWPTNEIWLLLSVFAGVTALIATFVTYRVCRGLLMFLFPEREHCHPCAKDAERRIAQQNESFRKAFGKLWNSLKPKAKGIQVPT